MRRLYVTPAASQLYWMKANLKCQLFSLLSIISSAFWKILMEGPPDTPYEKGTFELFCQFGSDYPVKPPLVRFITPVSCQTNAHLHKKKLI